MCLQYPQRLEEGIESPRNGVTGGSKLPYGCWELNLSPLKEQQILLITELSLQALYVPFFGKNVSVLSQCHSLVLGCQPMFIKNAHTDAVSITKPCMCVCCLTHNLNSGSGIW